MTDQHRLILLVVLATGCVARAGGEPSVGASRSAIRGGATDDGDPAVVALGILGAYTYCSGTLIAPHTILTAGHCENVGTEVEFGTQADSPSQSITIAETTHHPMYTSAGKPYDFALLRLDKAAAGVAPVPVNATALDPADVGKTIRHVGFGATDDSTLAGAGTKRTVSYSLNQVQAQLIYSGAPGMQTCSGDSGGPGFMTLDGQSGETLVGVISDGPDCQLSQDGWDGRADVVYDWIAQTVAAWDPQSGSGPDGSTSTGPSDGGDVSDAGTASDAGRGGVDPPQTSSGCSATGSTAGRAAWPWLAVLAFVVMPVARRRGARR